MVRQGVSQQTWASLLHAPRDYGNSLDAAAFETGALCFRHVLFEVVKIWTCLLQLFLKG
jgi:hypothetical protein